MVTEPYGVLCQKEEEQGLEYWILILNLAIPIVNYAKYWLDQFFLISGRDGFTYGCDHWGAASNQIPVY